MHKLQKNPRFFQSISPSLPCLYSQPSINTGSAFHAPLDWKSKIAFPYQILVDQRPTQRLRICLKTLLDQNQRNYPHYPMFHTSKKLPSIAD